jgi:hypothetical protein
VDLPLSAVMVKFTSSIRSVRTMNCERCRGGLWYVVIRVRDESVHAFQGGNMASNFNALLLYCNCTRYVKFCVGEGRGRSFGRIIREMKYYVRVKEDRNILRTIKIGRKDNWIGHILLTNCLLKQAIRGRMKNR